MKTLSFHHRVSLPGNDFFVRLRALLTRKIWLPKFLYEGLPFFYALFGLMAITSTLFVPGWYWMVPFSWLLGLMCLHGAIIVWRIRRAYRRHQRSHSHDA